MDEKTLSEFLKLDGLQIEEIGLWNNILKWGLAQNPYFDLLANTLKNLIPLITISQISSTDFHNKIWPFRYILPDKMLEEIMTYHLDPTSPPLPVPKNLAMVLIYDLLFSRNGLKLLSDGYYKQAILRNEIRLRGELKNFTNVPPTTKTLASILVIVSIFGAISTFKWPTGDNILSNLVVVPGVAISKFWTFLTAGFLETHLITLALKALDKRLNSSNKNIYYPVSPPPQKLSFHHHHQSSSQNASQESSSLNTNADTINNNTISNSSLTDNDITNSTTTTTSSSSSILFDSKDYSSDL
ncbi:11804_t:CDS:2 [Entrophospora sp. SA101]|nr:11804_t:CDS:2 [Entrophospora sp. SA101]